MRTYLDCYPCFLRQALEAACLIQADDDQQKAILDRSLEILKCSDLSSTPPEIGDQIHRLVRRVHQDGDPYREAKAASTRQALAQTASSVP